MSFGIMSIFTKHRILYALLWLSFCSYAQKHINFTPLTPVVNNKPVFVSKTIQDKWGNIWMLCSDGILVYDGYNYKPLTNSSIFKRDGERARDMIADDKQDIYIISSLGSLLKFDAASGMFEVLNDLFNNQRLKTIYHEGQSIWIATTNGKIYRSTNSKLDSVAQIFNNNFPVTNINSLAYVAPNNLFVGTENGKIFHYDLNSKNYTELIGRYTDYPGRIILTTDKNKRLWIGTEAHGIFVYDTATQEFIQDTLFSGERPNVKKELFLTLFNDSDGFIWGGTDGGGLYKINPVTGAIDLFYKQDGNEFSLGSNTILHINEDNHKNLWICTNYGKLSILPNVDNNIHYHEGSANHIPQKILSIYKSSKNTLWIGTDGSGLTKINLSDTGSTKETTYFNDSEVGRGHYIQSITEDLNGNIWIATYLNGLWFHDTQKNTLKKIEVSNIRNQKATDVRTLFRDSKGRIWVCSNISINVYTADQELLASFENNHHGLNGLIAEAVAEDQDGTIWIGIYNGGFFRFNEKPHKLSESSFSLVSHQNNTTLEGIFSVKFIAVGEPGVLWLLDKNGTFLKYNSQTNEYTTFEDLQVFKDVNLATIAKQDDHNLWFSSNNGIFHLNTKTRKITAYHSSDGLQSNIFLSRSTFTDTDGTLYFGGNYGLNYFDPTEISKKERVPELFVNSIEILNQPMEQLIPSYGSLSTYNLETLNLKSNQSSFSFRFSAIDNVLDPKYTYAYRLKGFNDDWIVSGQERLATYTNIPNGNYIFEVKAGTSKGLWNIAPKRIAVRIAPPFWKTPFAYILYAILIGFVLYALRRWYLLKNKLLVEKLIHKKENELYDLKMNFFTKMSHEIQTPITLILGPLEDMLKQSEENGNLLLNQRLKIIEKNGKRISKIARELTLMRNKEINALKLLTTKNNLYDHIQDISLSFKELARKKRIDFAINCPQNLQSAWYDKEKIEHVIYNLLSNAFKFTPKEGNVQLNVIPIDSKKQIKLSVSDTGSGIPKDELELIFDLFYQSKTNKKKKGSGIGLALTKELVDLHRGTMEVESSAVEGTIFTFTLPITKDAYEESEIIMTDDADETIPQDVDQLQVTQFKAGTKDISKKTILIVEDNYELQSFLKDLLAEEYNIILADNGGEGFHYAKSNFPDLILSDIMMPKMDGLEMCALLQQDELTKHIPVIILTAKNSTQSKLSGLKSGAIEYINKPFNTAELLLKIKNIISSKEHIISKYRKEVITSPEIAADKTQDEIFLENMTSIINAKLNDDDFKIEDLAESLNMSYSSLYRKCQALTGKNLVDYIRLIRLKRAAVLIAKYGYNISETAFIVGFKDPKYFSKCFKKQYFKSPKEFEREARKMGVDDYLKEHDLDHSRFNLT